MPPTQGIRATLATTGPTRVVVAGDGDYPTVVVRRAPESVAITAPRDATGLFDLDIQPEMMVPFENLGVEGMWEFRLPKASNPIDYDTIGDVLLTMEYTALDSGEYRRQVVRRLDGRVVGDRPFSFRLDFADAWYDLHNPDQTPTPMAVRFETTRRDYPPNIDNLTIQHLVLYFARADGAAFEVSISNLVFAPSGGVTTVEAALRTVDGLISTRQPSRRRLAAAQPGLRDRHVATGPARHGADARPVREQADRRDAADRDLQRLGRGMGGVTRLRRYFAHVPHGCAQGLDAVCGSDPRAFIARKPSSASSLSRQRAMGFTRWSNG